MPAFRMLTFYITMSTIIVHVDFLLIFMGFPRFCPHYLCYVDKLSSVDKFIIFSIFNNSLFYKGLWGYLPQQFLYFLPLPHGHGSFLPTLSSLTTILDLLKSLVIAFLVSGDNIPSHPCNSYNQWASAPNIL